MRRIVLWLATTVTIVVLLFGYHTSTNRTSSASAGTAPAPAAPSTSGSGQTGSGSSGSTGSGSGSSGSGSGSGATSYTGSVAQTRWGPVQVRITVSGDRITGVTVVQYPTGNPRDQQINDYALPILVQDTLDAQSAQIDMVSGATVTSQGYLTSLQSALDEAGR